MVRVILPGETSEMAAIFVLTTKTTQPRSRPSRSDRMQPKYLNTLYQYFPLNTLIYLNKRHFSLFLKMPPSI